MAKMIMSKDALFLDVGKTGTSFIDDMLSKIASKKGGRHSANKETLRENRLYYTCFRNPYKYYPSHLKYSIKTNGQIWKHVKTKHGFCGKSLYGYVEGINVQRWSMPETNHGNTLNLYWKNMPDDLGMLTCHYIIYLDQEFLKQKRTTQEVQDWFEQHWFKPNSNYILLNTERLKEDFCDLIEKHHDKFELCGNWQKTLSDIRNKDVSNTGKHKIEIKSYEEQYDNIEAKEIISHYERLIVNHFNYTLS